MQRMFARDLDRRRLDVRKVPTADVAGLLTKKAPA